MKVFDPAWREIIKNSEIRAIYRRFESRYGFRASTVAAAWPGIREPIPSITYQISGIWCGDTAKFDMLLADLCASTARSFRQITPPGQAIHVWDPNHEFYAWSPEIFERIKDPAAWGLTPLPDGDYIIFMNQTGEQGLFGHPWEQTICIFGRPLLDAFAKNAPKLFSKVVRRDGQVVNPFDPRARAS